MSKKIKGMDKLQKQLDAIANMNTTDAVIDGAEVIERASKENAPVDTGELRDSHGIEVISEEEVDIVVKAMHAMFIEYGTGMMRAQPFLRPAIDANKHKVAVEMGKEIDKEMREVI